VTRPALASPQPLALSLGLRLAMASGSAGPALELEADVGGTEENVLVPAPPAPHPTKRGDCRKRKDRKGFLWCPGCKKSHPASSFSLNQRVEMECKRLLDRVYNQAQTQGETKWLSEQKTSDEKLFRMLDHYRNILVSTEDPKQQKFSVAHYMESFKTQQGVEFLGEGQMMWQVQAIDFWKSPAGGSMSQLDAEAKWDDWVAHYKERGIIHDFVSPNQTKPLRLRIPSCDKVNFKNTAAMSKELEKVGQTIKKPKEADLGIMKGR